MSYDERLVEFFAPKEHEQFIGKFRADLDAALIHSTERRNSIEKTQRERDSLSNGLLVNVLKGDPKLRETVTKVKTEAKQYVKKPIHPNYHRTKVEPRIKLGSVSATFTPPFYTWSWQGGQSGDAQGIENVNGNSGTINLSAYSNDGGGVSVAGAVGHSVRTLVDNGVLDIFANPSIGYDLETWTVFASANAGGFFGLYVGQYTLQGEFITALVDQQISLASLGNTTGYPLSASIPVDGDHIYALWVWSGANASGDGEGFLDLSYSAGLATADINVPSISVYLYG